jgi:hypothetical protein
MKNHILVIIAGGSWKIWDINPDAGPVSASDAYVGTPFKVNKEYAQRFGGRWMILSAKYGLIEPDFIIPRNYNVTFKDPSTNPITVGQIKKQIEEKRLNEFKEVVVLGGKDYANVVSQAFAGFSVRIKTPITGLRLGVAVGKVKQAIKNRKPIDC